jgi:hypothetical protein
MAIYNNQAAVYLIIRRKKEVAIIPHLYISRKVRFDKKEKHISMVSSTLEVLLDSSTNI